MLPTLQHSLWKIDDSESKSINPTFNNICLQIRNFAITDAETRQTFLEVSPRDLSVLLPSQGKFAWQSNHFGLDYVDSFNLNTMSPADVKPVNLLLLSVCKRKIMWKTSRSCKLLNCFFAFYYQSLIWEISPNKLFT